VNSTDPSQQRPWEGENPLKFETALGVLNLDITKLNVEEQDELKALLEEGSRMEDGDKLKVPHQKWIAARLHYKHLFKRMAELRKKQLSQ
jgi:hypothetical protein